MNDFDNLKSENFINSGYFMIKKKFKHYLFYFNY